MTSSHGEVASLKQSPIYEAIAHLHQAQMQVSPPKHKSGISQ